MSNELKTTVEANGGTYDAITQPQEWIDGLVAKYAPNSHDVDVSIQNMGLELEQLQAHNQVLVEALELIAKIEGAGIDGLKATARIALITPLNTAIYKAEQEVIEAAIRYKDESRGYQRQLFETVANLQRAKEESDE